MNEQCWEERRTAAFEKLAEAATKVAGVLDELKPIMPLVVEAVLEEHAKAKARK